MFIKDKFLGADTESNPVFDSYYVSCVKVFSLNSRGVILKSITSWAGAFLSLKGMEEIKLEIEKLFDSIPERKQDTNVVQDGSVKDTKDVN